MKKQVLLNQQPAITISQLHRRLLLSAGITVWQKHQRHEFKINEIIIFSRTW